MDSITGRVFEVNGKQGSDRRLLLSRLRTAILRQDEEGQAHWINSLLRSYIEHNLYDQAEKLLGKITYPQSVNIKQLASRKVPTHGAVGFKQTVQKWLIIVELLLGDIPERAMFMEKEYKQCLAPYFQLTLAIRGGKLAHFDETFNTFAKTFKKDQTYCLIVRLRHNVIINTGICIINSAYSRISVMDVAKKLHVDNVDDVQFILAKAISQRTIDAQLQEDSKILVSMKNVNNYTTKDPFVAFDQRIKFCMDTYDQSVNAMRFPHISLPSSA